jgi:uncharacterized damage-inducible protein DinB
MGNQIELTIMIVLDAWNGQLSTTDELLNQLTDEQLQYEVSPGRNTGIYLLGHLTAVHDALLPLLDIDEKLYPELENIFIKNPDKSGIEKPSVKDLRDYWSKVNTKLSEHFNLFTPEEWLQKHTTVSEKDFKKEPHRNRLNVLVSRTNHLSYHRGQLAFLKT